MTSYETVPYTTYLGQTLALMVDPGLLLVAADAQGHANVMTIGWGTVGVIWGKPIFTVLVRPSRYTYGHLEASDSFTVCVPSPEFYEAVNFCGTRSGRDHDKFETCDLTPLPSTQVSVPGIQGCPVIYECRTVHTNDVLPSTLAPSIRASAYAGGDFHRIYYGQIEAVRALPGVADLLAARS